MASFEQHCQDCQKELGKPYRKVHIWLDSCYGVIPGVGHRDIRHNLRGIEVVRRLWGDEAAKAAVLHIMLDWGIKEHQIPKNQAKAAAFRKVFIKHCGKKSK